MCCENRKTNCGGNNFDFCARKFCKSKSIYTKNSIGRHICAGFQVTKRLLQEQCQSGEPLDAKLFRISRVDLQAVFICVALLIAICFMMLPGLMLPGWEAPRVGHLVREKFATKQLSAKHLRRLKALFMKRKRTNSSLKMPAVLDAVNETDDDDDSSYLDELEARRSGTQLIDMLRVLGDSAEGQARLFGFIATPPPPPRRSAVVEGAVAIPQATTGC